MKSTKQKRTEITTKRKARATKKTERMAKAQGTAALARRPVNSVLANPAALVPTNSYSAPPLFYVDKPFTCKDCGKAEIWTATQQKWWYEVAKGNIESTAIRCRPCRRREHQRKAEARRIHSEGLAAKKQRQREKLPS